MRYWSLVPHTVPYRSFSLPYRPTYFFSTPSRTGTVRYQYRAPSVSDSVLNPQGFVFSHGTFFCCTEPKKRFCEWVKGRTFKRFCRIFDPFFETLDTFGGFWKSTEPFRRVLQNSLLFSEQSELINILSKCHKIISLSL